MSIQRMTRIALLSAILYVSKAVLEFLPNIELVSLLVILYSLVFGWEAMLIVTIFNLFELIQWGFGTWWFSYLYVWPLLCVITMLLKKLVKEEFLIWAIVSGSFGLIFGSLFALFYLFVETQPGTRAIDRRLKEIIKETEPMLRQRPEVMERLYRESRGTARLAYYMNRYGGYPIWENTSAQYFPLGDDMYPVLLEELRKAERYIFMEYFIVEKGEMWDSILEILKEKAAAGVEVRFMYDGMCSLTLMPYGYPKQLEKYGIHCKMFSPVRPVLSSYQNNRDHRKICVIDGWTGFTGGINLADEYINQRKRFGHWKDTAVMLKGEGVWNMTAMFLYMWGIVTRTDTSLDFGNYVPHRWHPNEFPGNGYVQPFCDSPLDDEIVGENVYLNIINRAKNYVYICTPYLIIDNEMMTALCLAAKSGVDVRIMTPGIPDKKMVFLLTQSYYKQLLEAGVKIYEYQPGFLHAKSFVCDDKVGVVGTINLDYRSLYLHFEDGVWMYKNDVILDIRDDFTETLEYCDPIDLAFCQKRNIVVRAIQNVLRVFAPLL